MQQYALSILLILEREMFPPIYGDVHEKLFTRMIAYVVFSLEYVSKIANKLEQNLSFQHRSST